MSGFSITGVVVSVGQPQKISDKFSKAELLIRHTDGKYEQFSCFEAHNDRADALQKIAEGETVTVHFDLRGRQWQDKTFNTLALWKVDKAGNEATAPPQRPSQQATAPPALDNLPGDDDLPF
jgi:hypothetical protein